MKNLTLFWAPVSGMLSILLAVVFIVLGGASTSAGGEQVVAARENYLLLDERLIEKVENARLSLGTVEKHPANPLFGEERPWETQLSHMYASVIFDREEEIYKCWYYSHLTGWQKDIEPGPLAAEERNGHGSCATLYATSKDGIHWQKPELQAYLYKGKPTNIVHLSRFSVNPTTGVRF